MGFEKFTYRYPVNKTLRFRLKPIGRTEENIKKKGLLKQDEELANKYKKAKRIIDEYHKWFIEYSLEGFSFDIKKLNEIAELYRCIKGNRQEADVKKYEKLQGELRKAVAKSMNEGRHFGDKKFIKEELPRWLKGISINLEGIDDPQAIIGGFKGWTTYFKGFNENRKNVYTSAPHSTAIGHRLIHENLPRFLDNIERYERAKELGVNFSQIEESFEVDFDEIFCIKGFNKCLTQKGIERYNLLRGGVSEKQNKKRQGINEKINLFAQEAESENKKKIRSCQTEELYKQILSDRSTMSLRLEEITCDSDLCKEISSAYRIDEKGCLLGRYESVDEETGEIVEEELNIEEALKKALDLLEEADPKRVFIRNNQGLKEMSKQLFDDWRKISDCLEYYAENTLFPTPKGKRETQRLLKERERFKKRPYFSLEDIHRALEDYFSRYTKKELGDEDVGSMDMKKQKDIAMAKPLYSFFWSEAAKEKFKEVRESYKGALPVLEEYANTQEEKLKGEENKIQEIKRYLDSLMKGVYEFFKPLHFQSKDDGLGGYDRDSEFYIKFDEVYGIIENIVPLYNKTRNYLTKKPFSVEKFKLNFENQTLADGWSKTKEKDNSCILLQKDGRYFLGVMDKDHKKIFEGALPGDGECYQKMEYNLLPGPNKMFIKVFFSASKSDRFDPSEEIQKIRNHSSHTKNGSPQKGYEKKPFNPEDMQKMVDFFKESIKKHENWKKFNFTFSPTKEYRDINDFYQEVARQGYCVGFRSISVAYIDKCVQEGKLHLFQVYSKDFSEKSRGRPNLQTLYWRELFSERNLKDVVYKLDGEAELFYRRASISYGKDIWTKGHHHNDPKKKQKYPIIKDRRYAKDTFLFHVPITCNFKSGKIMGSEFNRLVRAHLKDGPEIRVIGIDRGERHLAYYSLMDIQGNILHQESFNTIATKGMGKTKIVNYHKALHEKEQDRGKARESWKAIGKIKDLKEGYLSQVVHKIVNLMVEHNAVVVFEDLNFGFKRERFKIEKQIYQKLEKMLIDKLNYLVFKDREAKDEGGVLKALQLTSPFESFKKLGKQTGFIFYVPAYYTSKICPATGFVKLLYPKYETIEKAKDFFSKFDVVSFNKADQYFEFHLNYGNFTNKAEGSRQDWIICTYGKRLEHHKVDNKWKAEEVALTKAMEKLFNEYSISFDDGKCFKDQICKQNKSDFFKSLFRLLRLTLQMRNSKKDTNEDWLISPVRNSKGEFFDSRKENNSMPKMPENADANGAYHIGLKGLLMLKQLKEAENVTKFKPDLSNRAWYQFVQRRGGNG